MSAALTPEAVACVRDQLRTHHLGAIHLDPLEGGDLIAQAVSDLYASFGSEVALWGAVDPPRRLDDHTPPIIVIEGFEQIVDHRDPCSIMGRVREIVHEVLDSSRRVLLLTTVHPSRLSHCHASSVLIDAKHIDLRRALLARDPLSVLVGELKPFAATLVSQTRLLGLATCFDCDEKPDVVVRRLVRRSASLLGEDHGTELLEELRYAHQLGHFDSRGGVNGIKSSGVFRLAEWIVNESDDRTSSFRDQLLRTLAETIGTLTVPPADLGNTFALLFEIERSLRRIIVAACQEANRQVHTVVPEGLIKRANDRAEQSNAPMPPWNICEWLTTDELLDVIQAQPWMRPRRLSERMLIDLRREVIPVRNAVAHFRASTPRERQSLKRWHAAISSLAGSEHRS